MRNLWCGMLAVALVACGGADASVADGVAEVTPDAQSPNRVGADADAAPAPVQVADAGSADADSCPYVTLQGPAKGVCGPLGTTGAECSTTGELYACEPGAVPRDGCLQLDTYVLCPGVEPVFVADDKCSGDYPLHYNLALSRQDGEDDLECQVDGSSSWRVGSQYGWSACCKKK